MSERTRAATACRTAALLVALVAMIGPVVSYGSVAHAVTAGTHKSGTAAGGVPDNIANECKFKRDVNPTTYYGEFCSTGIVSAYHYKAYIVCGTVLRETH